MKMSILSLLAVFFLILSSCNGEVEDCDGNGRIVDISNCTKEKCVDECFNLYKPKVVGNCIDNNRCCCKRLEKME
ncbi:hypothetical protein SLE2022_016850 [Rubroshorea leprosula]